MRNDTAEQLPAPGRSRHGRGRRLPTLLLLVALLPVLGLLAVVGVSAQRLERERRDAAGLQDEADRFHELIEARTAVTAEEVASAVLVIGSDLGVTAEQLGEMFDQDFVADLEAARAAVDADPTLPRLEAVQGELAALRAVRARVDAGSVTFDELLEVTESLSAAIDRVWDDRVGAQVQQALDSELPAAAQVRFQGLTAAYIALSAGSERALLTEVVLMGTPSATQLERLVSATGEFRAAAAVFPGRLGPAGTRAWARHLGDPAAERFLTVLDETIAAVAAATDPPLRGQPEAFGEAYIDGPVWAWGMADTVTAAADDVKALAADHAADATRGARLQLGLALLLGVVSLAGAVVVARAVTRPMRRLEEAAHQVQRGRFELEPLREDGPRELADTARAFNEMASTLAAVERHAVALADDVEAPVLSRDLPGRTGRALQVALNRLRSSMQVAEQRRRDLEQAATHDSLTGLLNRAAAFEVVGRDLLRTGRDGGTVAALYIDLDGLKPINDRYTHAAGDDALRETAEALRSVTRGSDVVARLGGDEFLVAGVLAVDGDDRTEAEDLAERVRAAVAARAVQVEGATVPLHCSVGIAIAAPGASLEALVNEADAALLQAKRLGKDRIAWSPDRASEDADVR